MKPEIEITTTNYSRDGRWIERIQISVRFKQKGRPCNKDLSKIRKFLELLFYFTQDTGNDKGGK